MAVQPPQPSRWSTLGPSLGAIGISAVISAMMAGGAAWHSKAGLSTLQIEVNSIKKHQQDVSQSTILLTDEVTKLKNTITSLQNNNAFKAEQGKNAKALASLAARLDDLESYVATVLEIMINFLPEDKRGAKKIKVSRSKVSRKDRGRKDKERRRRRHDDTSSEEDTESSAESSESSESGSDSDESDHRHKSKKSKKKKKSKKSKKDSDDEEIDYSKLKAGLADA